MPRRKLVTRGLALSALVGLFAVAPSCANFTPLASNVCGNSVIDEATEDCDSHAPEENTHCGAAETTNACRFVCVAKTKTDVCPTGWGCGVDGLCRQRNGTFEPLGDLVPFASPHDLRVSDFDGDGTVDVLLLGEEDSNGLSPARIVFSATAETPRRVVALPVNIASPVAGDLDGEGASELAFADLKGISVFQARTQDRAAFAPFPTVAPLDPTSIRAIPMEILPGPAGDEVVALVRAHGPTLNGPPSLVGLDTTTTPPALVQLTTLPADETKLIGPIVWGQVDEGAKCQQIVFPFQGFNSVPYFTPCLSKDGAVAWNEKGSLLQVQLPSGEKIDRGVLLVDLDLDQHLDLLIGAGGQNFVAWGLGDGTFTSAKVGGTIGVAGPYSLPSQAGDEATFPLAAADLNGDGSIDFVVPSGLVISTPSGYTVTQGNAGSWSQAVIADFNADGRLDVATGATATVDIDLFINAGGGVFNASTVPTDGPTSNFIVGDFDGDLVTDLAFTQELTQASGAEDDLSISFGAAYGKLSAPVITASLGEIAQLAPARFFGTDGIADVVAVSRYVTQSIDAMFLFEGAGSRTLQAPLRLDTEKKTFSPVALTSGSFGNKLPNGSPQPDLIALGADPNAPDDLHLWRIDQAAALVLEHLRPSPPLPLGFFSNAPGHKVSFAYGASLAASDLDGDSIDEVVLAAPFGPEGGAALLIARYDPGSLKLKFGEAQKFPAVLSVDSTLRLLDVDGDGHLDGVLTTGTDEAPGDLLVFWGDGQGGLDTATPGRISRAGGFTDVACLPLPSGPGCDLFAVNQSGATEIKAQRDHSLTVTPRSDLAGGRGIGAGDFNGDGLLDLAIQTTGGLQLFRSVPRRE